MSSVTPPLASMDSWKLIKKTAPFGLWWPVTRVQHFGLQNILHYGFVSAPISPLNNASETPSSWQMNWKICGLHQTSALSLGCVLNVHLYSNREDHRHTLQDLGEIRSWLERMRLTHVSIVTYANLMARRLNCIWISIFSPRFYITWWLAPLIYCPSQNVIIRGKDSLRKNFEIPTGVRILNDFLVKPKNKDHVLCLWIFCVLLLL